MSKPRKNYDPPMQEAIVTVEVVKPACKTCPLWEATADGLQGVCHGTSGPLTMFASKGLFPYTTPDQWCRLHPAAPKTN